MTSYNLREIEALERIASALEVLARTKDRNFTPAHPPRERIDEAEARVQDGKSSSRT